MKICILTQTASDISDSYKSFFKDTDFYFLTFKNKNDKAIDFLPKSTWSEGRNRLYDEVKGKYDYYLFIDDDLKFFKAKFSFSAIIQYLYHSKLEKNVLNTYSVCSPDVFFSQLNKAIKKYKPEVLSVKNLNNRLIHPLDSLSLRRGRMIRRMGWFDAQFTLFSDYAAQRLLPYDNNVSGWASAQILIYVIAYHTFRSKAITLNSIAVNNEFHSGAYVPDYVSHDDCRTMVDLLYENVDPKHKILDKLWDDKIGHVNLDYGKDQILKHLLNKENVIENYKENFKSIEGIQKLMLPNKLQF